MADETHNGWKNYPTWAVNLWLSNDEGLYNETLERVRATIEDADNFPTQYWTEDENRRFKTADMLRDWIANTEIEDGGFVPDLGASMQADLFGYVLQLVDWDELADAWIEAHAETVNA